MDMLEEYAKQNSRTKSDIVRELIRTLSKSRPRRTRL